MKRSKILLASVFIIMIMQVNFSCRKFVEVDPPRTDLVRTTVFESDETATAAALDMYYQLHFGGFASGDFNSISFFGALSADEAINLVTINPGYQQFNDNALLPTTPQILVLWTDLYRCNYKANAILEGIAVSRGLSEKVKRQLEGEAKFIRAFCHFYLVNLWGDIPLVLNTNYEQNLSISRSPTENVYSQIVIDLRESVELLDDGYSISDNQRIRANKGAALALLARAYLYIKDWPNAEDRATTLINNTSIYTLVPLNGVFIKNNSEAIFQLPPRLGNAFDVETATIRCKLHSNLIDSFEDGDQRRLSWISENLARKYKSTDNSKSEYSVVLRLAEQYLIRAEARIGMNDFEGARQDLNTIRVRAGLMNIESDDKASLLLAVESERRRELFLEWGHRWFDLKRTDKADALLKPIKLSWQSSDVLYPIPEAQILNDPAMRDAQNIGY